MLFLASEDYTVPLLEPRNVTNSNFWPPKRLMNVFGETLAELDTSAVRCLHLLRGGMKCEYSFVSGGHYYRKAT